MIVTSIEAGSLHGVALPGLPPNVYLGLPRDEFWSLHRLTVRMVPPTLNRIPGMHWSEFKKIKQAWQREIEHELMVAQVRKGQACALAGALITFTRVTRRDAGNFSIVPEKALGDALVNGRWLPDDTPDYFRFVGVEFNGVSGDEKTEFVLLTKEEHGNR